MRDQILESFNHREFSLMVVGNKYDLVPDASRQSQVCVFTHSCMKYRFIFQFAAILLDFEKKNIEFIPRTIFSKHLIE